MPRAIILNDPAKPYKAIYAFVMATLTAASGIWLNNPYLTMALAGLTAVGTYFVPNPLTSKELPDPDEEGFPPGI